MTTKGAAARLRIDLKRFNEDPTPLFLAKPIESNILEWRFVMMGAPDTPYEGGFYHGKLTFPQDYPWKPPSVQMITPSGRFNVNTRICLSISDFHPESWCPSYTVGTILTGIISFFNSEESTVGSVVETVEKRREIAKLSHAFNLKDRVYVELFGKMDPNEQFLSREKRPRPPGDASDPCKVAGGAPAASSESTAEGTAGGSAVAPPATSPVSESKAESAAGGPSAPADNLFSGLFRKLGF